MNKEEARNRNLLRFLHAQDSGGLYDGTGTYAEALQEVKVGHKRGHWMWYVFPQMKGLGHSEMAEFYGINGREEAKAYIGHPVLKERLIEICEAVLNNEHSAYEIFGADTIKFRACILLFASVSDIPVSNKSRINIVGNKHRKTCNTSVSIRTVFLLSPSRMW